MLLRSKKIAMFVENMYEDLKFCYHNIRMKEEGAEIKKLRDSNDY